MTTPISHLATWIADNTACHMCGHPKGVHTPPWWPYEDHGCHDNRGTSDGCECAAYEEQTR